MGFLSPIQVSGSGLGTQDLLFVDATWIFMGFVAILVVELVLCIMNIPKKIYCNVTLYCGQLYPQIEYYSFGLTGLVPTWHVMAGLGFWGRALRVEPLTNRSYRRPRSWQATDNLAVVKGLGVRVV